MSKRRLQPEQIKRVVVRGANWIGDAMMTVPALRELRRVLPGAHITLATRAWAEGLFDNVDFLDDIMVADDGRRGWRARVAEVSEWRRRRFDLALLFPNAFAPAMVAWAARVPVRAGYATDGRRPLLTHSLNVPEWRGARHEVFYYLNIVAELECLLTGATQVEAASSSEWAELRLDLRVSIERQHEAREILRRHGAKFDRPLVVLCPGSTNSRAKRWPAERFAALANQLVEEAGAEVALIGAPEERDVSQEVASLTRHRLLILTGETSLAQTVALLSVCNLLITNDTGPAHIAAAINLPTLVIFGPTDPVTTRPYSAVAEVVRQPPVCAPCMLRDCPIDHRCMTAITPADIFARATHIIEQQSATVVGGTR